MHTSQLSSLAREFALLATDLRSGTDIETALCRLTYLAVETIPDASSASVTLLQRGAYRSICATDPVAEGVDSLAYALGEGPCLQALSDSTILIADNLSEEQRWPRFCAEARDQGVRAAMSFRLQLQPGGSAPASLNVYSSTPRAFAQEGVALGLLMVAHVDMAIAAARSQERALNLEKALDSNREIGVAMGILMARQGVTEDQAFALLRRTSQSLNRKIRDLAEQVAQTGELPTPPVRPLAPASTAALVRDRAR